MWMLVTDLEKAKQAPAVVLSLPDGPLRSSALTLPTADLHADEGMRKLLEHLDNELLKDLKDRAYVAYSNFEKFTRTPAMSMFDYIQMFELKQKLAEKFDMKLPDSILAYKLLENSGLSETDRVMVKTAVQELKYDAVKSAMRRIFGEGLKETPIVKEEPVFAAELQRTSFYGRRNNSPKRQVNGTNPKNKEGRITTCRKCGSRFHWEKNCPEIVSEADEVTAGAHVLAVWEEALACCGIDIGILDTACSETVCGSDWLDRYVSNLPLSLEQKVKKSPARRYFKFGDGKCVTSDYCVLIPAEIADTKCLIRSQIVPGMLPLLISKSSLKSANAKLDLTSDTAELFGKVVQLQTTPAGHYFVNLMPQNEVYQSEVNSLSEGDLRKLHVQFGHCPNSRLSDLLKQCKKFDARTARILERVVEGCRICTQHQPSGQKPIVSLPMATDFNETVAMDLHKLDDNMYYLHVIDLFSRFSRACIVRSKKGVVIVNKLICLWISLFGAPKKILSDNGGEFNNELVRELGDKYNIRIMGTAAFSPWSNGICERHNAVLTCTFEKLMAEGDFDVDTCILYASMVKNMYSSTNGFSPYQLVFGRNPNLPDVLTDDLPALQPRAPLGVVHDHLRALQQAKLAYFETQASQKVKLALSKNIRDVKFIPRCGDRVFYKRCIDSTWSGPANVIGLDGKIVFVRHGGAVLRIHVSQVRPAKETDVEQHEITDKEETGSSFSGHESYFPTSDDDENEADRNVKPELNSGDPPTTEKYVTGVPKPRQKVWFQPKPEMDETQTWYQAEILSRAGKRSGKHSTALNVRYLQPDSVRGQEVCLDWEQAVENWRPENDADNIPSEDVLIVSLKGTDSFAEEKLKEIQNWRDNDVFEEVDFENQYSLSTKWVCTVKERLNPVEKKARLVVRGFEDVATDIASYSPTVSMEVFNLVLAVIASKGWSVQSMDVKAAFLQGDRISRDVFVTPPREFRVPGKVWKLKKAVYGLKEAPRNWYFRLCSVLMDLGLTKCALDPSVFAYYLGEIKGIIAVHVDDLLVGGDTDFETQILRRVREKLRIGREQKTNFKHLGLNVEDSSSELRISQNQYANQLRGLDSKDQNGCMKNFRGKLGQLNWICLHTRPDLAYGVSALARTCDSPSADDYNYMNKLIRQIKAREDFSLGFPRDFGNLKDAQLVCFSDSAFANLDQGGSQGGFIIFLFSDGKNMPVIWKSNKIRRVARSTITAETLALLDAIDCVIFVRKFLQTLLKLDSECIPAYCFIDSKSLAETVLSNSAVLEKRLRIDIAAIREVLENGLVSNISWVSGKQMLADSLTKKHADPTALLECLEYRKLNLSLPVVTENQT